MTKNQKKHLDKVHTLRRSKYGTWQCKKCNLVFETRALLNKHNFQIHGKKTVIKTEFGYMCPYCSKEFKEKTSILGHLRSCKSHPNSNEHIQQRIAEGKRMHEAFELGEKIPVWTGRKHSEESKRKMRISAAKYLQTIRATPCRYNKSSIAILESIAKEHGWNIQHAENGGEFYTGIGYFVDAYDKEKNIVLEFDEAAHYVDAKNNVLSEEDIKRQKEIIDHLHCEYWRYNSVTNVLWKVK